jgi:hypothetical protein
MKKITLKETIYKTLELAYGKDTSSKIVQLNQIIKVCRELKKMYESELEVFGEIK